MYLFELLYEFFKSPKYRRKNFDPLSNSGNNLNTEEDCCHCFLPLDSSEEYFACKYCGLILPREKLKDKNIFRQKH